MTCLHLQLWPRPADTSGKVARPSVPAGIRQADAAGSVAHGSERPHHRAQLSLTLCICVEPERQRRVDREQDFLFFRREGHGSQHRSYHSFHPKQLSCFSGLPVTAGCRMPLMLPI